MTPFGVNTQQVLGHVAELGAGLGVMLSRGAQASTLSRPMWGQPGGQAEDSCPALGPGRGYEVGLCGDGTARPRQLHGPAAHPASRPRSGSGNWRSSAAARLSASACWRGSSRPSACTPAPWTCSPPPWAAVPRGTARHPPAAAPPRSPAADPAPKVR